MSPLPALVWAGVAPEPHGRQEGQPSSLTGRSEPGLAWPAGSADSDPELRPRCSPSSTAAAGSPVWPCNFCTTSFVCRFQMYTRLSSEPDTIHCGRRREAGQRVSPSTPASRDLLCWGQTLGLRPQGRPASPSPSPAARPAPAHSDSHPAADFRDGRCFLSSVAYVSAECHRLLLSQMPPGRSDSDTEAPGQAGAGSHAGAAGTTCRTCASELAVPQGEGTCSRSSSHRPVSGTGHVQKQRRQTPPI